MTDDLIDDPAEDLIGENPEDLTPREIRKIKFAKSLIPLRKLADNLHRLTKEDRNEAMRLFSDAEKLGCELSFVKFFKCAWQHMDTAAYKHNWHIDLLAQAAEDIITGKTRRLIINVPPRTGKSNLISVALIAWVWIQSERGPLSGPHVKFLCSSYGQSLSFNHSILCRNLIMSPWYQNYWGHRFKLKDDRNAVGFFENDKGGYRIATSVGAGLTGLGGDVLVIDDPHNTQDVVSDADRQSAINWYSQSLSTRLNDPKTGAFVTVMQRQHENDLTGYILDNEADMWEHIVLRMRYEGNPYLEYDQRTEEGELLWPERIPEEELIKLETTLGSHGTAGQLQQRPFTKGGGIIKAPDWQLFPPKGQEDDWKKDGVLCWPPFEFVVASLDGAFSEKTMADYSALTIWGLWYDKTGMPKIVCVYGWQDRLSFNPLVMRVGNNCRKFKVDTLLIEAKANGISVSQEIRRVFGVSDWSTQLVQPKGDKVARALSVQGLFEEGLIYAPDREWAQMVIDNCAAFPMGKHDDVCDTVTQALRWMRDNGLIKRKDEKARADFEGLPRPGDFNQPALYDV